MASSERFGDEDGVCSPLDSRCCQNRRLRQAFNASPDRWQVEQRRAGESRAAAEADNGARLAPTLEGDDDECESECGAIAGMVACAA